jgi:membrane protease subunit (stomatin/prohibitin family)
MGLFKAIGGAAGGVLADQWREYIYCDALEADVLVKKGRKRVSARSSNTKGDENIISNGSIVAVNDGQCMVIVDQGKVVEFCAEPGEFRYDTSKEPSLFYGSLGKSIVDTFKTIGKRFTFGGDTARDQRVYYFNTKEIIGNKYGTPNPVPFRVVDKNIGLDIDIAIRCHGEYSYKITDPLLFYANVCGNVPDVYRRDRIDSQLKSELMTALQPAFAKISDMGIRYSALPGHTMEMAEALNDVLSLKWAKLRGIQVASFGINSVKASEEDEQMIKELQRNAVMRDPTMAAATLVGAQAQAMQDAARNEATGPMFGFAGLNMAANAGGMNAGSLYAMGRQQAAGAQQGEEVWTCPKCGARSAGNFCMQCGERKPGKKAEEGEWTCPKCGRANAGKFCVDCGEKRPEGTPVGWTCEKCGHLNKGKFCAECGAKKPAGARLYKCDKCGWEPDDPTHPPKFCPECGDIFDDSDAK